MTDSTHAIHSVVLRSAHCHPLLQDISGFSALNEHFSQQGGEGLGHMMSLVNMYFQQVCPACSPLTLTATMEPGADTRWWNLAR